MTLQLAPRYLKLSLYHVPQIYLVPLLAAFPLSLYERKARYPIRHSVNLR